MYELLDKLRAFKKSKHYLWARALVRGGISYIFFAIMFLLSSYVVIETLKDPNLRTNLPYEWILKPIFMIVLWIFTLNSATYVFSVFDSVTRNRFLRARHESKNGEEELEGEPTEEKNLYLIEFVTMVLFCFLFPIYTPYEALFDLLPFSLKIPSFVVRVLLTAAFTVVVFVMMLKNQSTAQKYWLQKHTQAFNRRGYVATDEINKTAYRKHRLVLWLIGYTVGYYAVGMALCWVVPAVWSLAAGVWLALQEASILLLIAVILLFIFGKVLSKRLQFYFRIHKFSKKYGFRVLERRGFFRSMFFAGGSYHLVIESRGKRYYCRILSGWRRKNRLQLFADGTMKRISGFHLPTFAIMVQSRFAMGAVYIERSHVDDRELFRIERQGKYAFDCEKDGKKILILNPVPVRVSLGTDPHHNADNGDQIGEYSVYTGGAFLRALANDAVRDPN